VTKTTFFCKRPRPDSIMIPPFYECPPPRKRRCSIRCLSRAVPARIMEISTREKPGVHFVPNTKKKGMRAEPSSPN